MWLLLAHPLLGTWPITQACTLTGNQTGDPLVHRPTLNPLSHTSQGTMDLFKVYKSVAVSAFTELYVCHHHQFQNITRGPRRELAPFAVTWQPLAAVHRLPLSMGLPILGLPYKWNRVTRGPSCLASFTQPGVPWFIHDVAWIRDSFFFIAE